MKLHTVPATQGAQWVRQGFRSFFKRPVAFAALFASFLFGMLVLLMAPFVGSLLLLMALPLVSLGFMIATRRSLGGEPVTPGVYLEPLRQAGPRRKALLRLMLAYALGSFLIMALSEWVDGGSFEALQAAMTSDSSTPQQIAALLADPRLFWGMVVRFGLASLLALPFWHAPALVHWQGQGAAQSLFISTVACWRNKGALLVYGLAWMAVILVFSLAANVVSGLLGEPRLVALAAMPAGLMFSTIFYASLYFTYNDSFVADTADPAAAAGPASDNGPLT